MKTGFEDMAKTFAEENNDLLILMEESLLDIQENGITQENINAVFRAAHTIKGAGGIFELNYLVEFTHNIENLLDDIRNEKIVLTEDILELLFKARDQIQVLVDFAINSDEEEPDDKINSLSHSLLHEISLCLEEKPITNNLEGEEGSEQFIDNEIEKLIEKNKENRKNLTQKTDSSNYKIYKINLSFQNEALLNGIEPIEFINTLNEMGVIKNTISNISNLPLIDIINTNEVYIEFEFIYECSQNINQIKEIFNLAGEFCEVIIEEYPTNIIQTTGSNSVIKAMPSSSIGTGKETHVQLKEIIPQSTIEVPKTNELNLKIRASSTLKVDAQKIDTLINLIGEMVIANSNVVEQVSKEGNKETIESVSVLSRMLEEMREASMQTRMVPIGDTFSRFKRVVRDLSKELNKEIDLEIIGAETELDKTVVEKIADPLMHLVRNSIDHGIELPDERIEKNKDRKGTLTLKAYHEAGSIVIEMQDDGKGLNPDFLFKKSIEKGIISEDTVLTTDEKLQLIMKPGFSTATSVTSISGRGVGMDVVKKNIEDLRGVIELKSQINKGTSTRIRLPLTLAIIDGFLTKVGEKDFIIPLEMVVECIELKKKYKKEFKENKYINLRGHILSILDLREFFKVRKVKSKRENIVIVRFANTHIGLIVNELQGEFQTVIKPLGRIFRNITGIGGATILGSGKVALILDIPMLMQNLDKSRENLKRDLK